MSDQSYNYQNYSQSHFAGSYNGFQSLEDYQLSQNQQQNQISQQYQEYQPLSNKNSCQDSHQSYTQQQQYSQQYPQQYQNQQQVYLNQQQNQHQRQHSQPYSEGSDFFDLYRLNGSENGLEFSGQSPQQYYQQSPVKYYDQEKKAQIDSLNNQSASLQQQRDELSLIFSSETVADQGAIDQRMGTNQNDTTGNEAYASIFTSLLSSPEYLVSPRSINSPQNASQPLSNDKVLASQPYGGSSNQRALYNVTNPYLTDTNAEDADHYFTSETIPKQYSKPSLSSIDTLSNKNRSNVIQMIDESFSPTGGKARGHQIGASLSVSYDDSQIEALADYTNQVMHLVDNKVSNSVSEYLYDTDSASYYSASSSPAKTKFLNSAATNSVQLPGAFSNNKSDDVSLRYSKSVAKPLGPRKPPPTFSSSVASGAGSPHKINSLRTSITTSSSTRMSTATASSVNTAGSGRISNGSNFSKYDNPPTSPIIDAVKSATTSILQNSMADPVSPTKNTSFSEMQTYQKPQQHQQQQQQFKKNFSNDLSHSIKASASKTSTTTSFSPMTRPNADATVPDITMKKIQYSKSLKMGREEAPPVIKKLTKTPTWADSQTTQDIVLASKAPIADITIKKDAKLPPLPSLDLPALPFSSSSLTDSQLKQCVELWSLSKLFKWCKLFNIWFKDAFIPKKELIKSLAALIRHRYSKLSDSLIEDNVDTIIEEFEKNGCVYYKNLSLTNAVTQNKTSNNLSPTDNVIASMASSISSTYQDTHYVFFNDNATINGVLPLLSSCYSTRFNHRINSSNKKVIKEYLCYANSCPRELTKRVTSHATAKSKRVITELTGLKPNGESEIGDSWVDHWNITKEELSEIDEATQQRQSHMFDLIKAEQRVVNHGRIILDVYGKSFLQQLPPLISPDDNFYQNAFLTVEPILRTHKEKLLEPLIIKLKEGKFMTGVADLYSNWVHEAYMPYLKYVEKMVSVRDVIERELKSVKNTRFAVWIKRMDSDPRVTAFRVDHGRLFGPSFLGATMNLPITLREIQKNTSPTDPEYKRLDKALKSVKKLINKFNTMQAHALRNQTLMNLANSLVWKNGTETDLGWESPDRRIIKRGQVSKKREMWLNSYSHLILLDNCLLITDEVKDSAVLKRYKVVEKPISMKFLLVETDLATAATNKLDTSSFASMGSTGSGTDSLKKFPSAVVSPGGAVGSSALGSTLSRSAASASEPVNSNQDPVLYPFKVRHIGRESVSFTFYTNSQSERSEWLEAFKDVQSKFHALQRQNEPFKLRVISDAAFAYDRDEMPHKSPIYPANSVIDLALQEVKEQYPGPFVPRPLMYSKVTASASFTYDGKEYILVGLGFGVFLSDATEIRNWKRVLELKNVTQLKVLEEFNLLVVLADRILQYYKLDSIFTVYKGIRNKTIGQKLSKQYVSFFKIGQQKQSTLLFYCKQKVSSSACYFKVMIPKLDDATNSFEYFEEYRKFNIQAECFNLTLFNTTFAIHTVKGFEILSLSILQPQSIPILMDLMSGTRLDNNGNVDLIKKKLNLASCKPMGLYKINDNKELLLVYNELAIICNNHGGLSRYSILQFTFRCSRVAFQDGFLIIIGKNVVEVFQIDGNTCVPGTVARPVQVISGKEITLVDDTPGKIKLSILHPAELGRQLVVELVPNDFYHTSG